MRHFNNFDRAREHAKQKASRTGTTQWVMEVASDKFAVCSISKSSFWYPNITEGWAVGVIV